MTTVYSDGKEIQEPITTFTSITTIVEKVYKGNLKAGDEMIFGQGENADCFVNFQEQDVGALLRVRGERSLDRRTESIRVEADGRLDGVDLRFPFPSCNGEKIRSQRRVD